MLHSIENGSTQSSHLRVYLNVKHQPYCSVKILPQSEVRHKSKKYLTDTLVSFVFVIIIFLVLEISHRQVYVCVRFVACVVCAVYVVCVL